MSDGTAVIPLCDLTKFFKTDNTWFFGVYLKIDSMLMQEAEVRFLQRTGE